ncbi:MAG: hypothetical protein PHH54_07405 [Candidatus Nanoarchaeia archaeon]|nr:hypothetical protein [Candidatus Nanoarchaeia archaeon]MDD5741782.1 hypothetical protein [Candidatus Nanoarchaeia archaeon]
MDNDRKSQLEIMSKQYNTPVEVLDRVGKSGYIMRQLSMWIEENFEDFVKCAPEGTEFIVGIAEVNTDYSKQLGLGIQYTRTIDDAQELNKKYKLSVLYPIHPRTTYPG